MVATHSPAVEAARVALAALPPEQQLALCILTANQITDHHCAYQLRRLSVVSDQTCVSLMREQFQRECG